MTCKLLITLSCGVFLLAGCREYAYYQSPFHGNNSGYKVMPTASDKPVAEMHADGALYTGGSGDRLRDGQWGFNGSVYRSHSFGKWRGFYGITGGLGRYRVRSIFNHLPYDLGNKYPNDSLINFRAGSKFFGGLGGTAGLYITDQFKDGGEWRVMGVELNYQNEFGRYLSFRKNLPDTAANLVSKSEGFFTIGIHSDLNLSMKRGFGGLKIGAVFSTERLTRYSHNGDRSNMTPGYFSMTFHLTRDRITSYWQTNLGTFVANTMLGISYRLND